MIKSFNSKLAENIYHGINDRYTRKLPSLLHKKAQRLLDQINAATQIYSSSFKFWGCCECGSRAHVLTCTLRALTHIRAYPELEIQGV